MRTLAIRTPGRAVLERPSSQMSYLDHFLKESRDGSGSTTHTNSTLAVNMVIVISKLRIVHKSISLSICTFFYLNEAVPAEQSARDIY